MIIVDPVSLGDVACTRPSPKWVFDKTGALVQVPAGTFAISYDPTDLTKAPYAVVEPAATNLVTASDTLTTGWVGTASVAASGKTYFGRPYQRISKTLSTAFEQLTFNFGAVTGGQTVVLTIALRGDTSADATVGLYDTTGASFGSSVDAQARIVSGPGTIAQLTGGAFNLAQLSPVGNTLVEIKRTYVSNGVGSLLIYPGGTTSTTIGDAILATRVQIELDRATSYIPTTTAPVTRAADVLGSGAGLVYSNVPITEPDYNPATSYPKDVIVHDPATHNTYVSLIAGNLGKALSDDTAWAPNGATNRWAMLDQYNNTQTTNADEIILVVSPQAVSQGLYVGNVYADDVRISVSDLTEGLVYSATQALVTSNSGSSFFNWCFKRIQRQDYFGTLGLPPYANGLITVTLRKAGGVAKCGMFAVGPVDDFGPALHGLSTEGKDYSSTTFNFDGTSTTVIRPYAKRMTCDLVVDNDQIDYVQTRLFAIRQKLVIWFGGPYGITVVAGRYESFKNVISYPTHSQMNLTIGGAV